jgi:5-methylthioadenosine/S-adenosylhomocysteine deaminase
LIDFAFAPHAPYTVSDDTLRKVRSLRDELETPIHIHLLETKWEIKHSIQHHGIHPLARLERLGLLNEQMMAVHMTQLTAGDIERVAAAGVHVVHCPQSNLKLASGICPLNDLLQAGVNVALGTDGAASNNDLDLLAEAQSAALLAKGISGDAKVVSAFEALEMLTLNGARALGKSAELGSIEKGKWADLCAVDLSEPETQPLHNVVSQLIYAASRRQVSDVWVGGRRLLQEGRLTTIELEAVLENAGLWRQQLARQTGVGVTI